MPSITTRPLIKSILLAGAIAIPLLVPSGSPAQLQGLQVQVFEPMIASDPSVKDPSSGVTVPDSLEAAKDLETAYAMERQKDWAKAANWYQEVMSKYRNKVAPAAKDKDNVLRLYTSVSLQVRRQLAKWPPDGVAAYRARYEVTAAALLDQAGRDDLGALNQVFNTYFLTESAKVAALRLIDAHLERGEFDRAAEFGDVLLQDYPATNLEVERPRLLYRTALAYYLCGDEKTAQDRLATLKAKFPDTVAVVFGKEVNLAQNLDQQLRIPPTAATGLVADSWPMLGGTPDRSAISQGGGRTGALEYHPIELSRSSFRGPQRSDLQREESSLDKQGVTLGVIPSVDRGEMFFQDGQRVYAVSLESGVPLPGWAQTYNTGTEHSGQFFLHANGSTRTQQLTVTVTDTAVVAIMGQSNPLARLYEAQGVDASALVTSADGTKLVCLDRETGKDLWGKAITPSMMPDDKLRALDFCGSPIVVGDNIYLLGRGGTDFQFDNCYLLCFDLHTGNYNWSCFIASTSNGNPYEGAAGMASNSASVSHLAYSGGRLYVLSNLGALASVDAYTGTILWLAVYPRERGAMDQPFNPFNGGFNNGRGMSPVGYAKPWESSPVFAADGRIFVLPHDSKYIFIYDAGTGLEIKRILLSDLTDPDPTHPEDPKPDPPKSLLAVMGDNLIAAGDHTVTYWNWRQYDPDHLPPIWKERIVWRAGVPQAIMGRSFVTVDSVFIPTSDALYRADMREGNIVQRYPVSEGIASGRAWDETQQEGPGNVLVTSEHVVLAAARTVNVYTDLVMARKKLDAEVAAAPGDPDPHLRYAEVMFGAGEFDITFQKLDAAIQLLGGLQSMRPGASRDKLFNDTITWAQKLAREKSGSSIEHALKMYDLVGAAAYGDSQQVNYRMSRAKFARTVTDPDNPNLGTGAAVSLYQEILSNPNWGRVPLSTDDGAQGVAQAAAVAEQLIAEIIGHDPSAYSVIEKRALASLDAATSAPEAERAGKLLDVAKTYPNSAVAPKAMLLAAAGYEAAGDAGLATHVLVSIYRKYSDRSDNLKIIQAMARNYLMLARGGRLDGVGVALHRLEKAAERSPTAKLDQALTLPDGAPLDADLTLEKARDQLAAWVQAHATAATAPDFHIPPSITDQELEAGKSQPKPFLPTDATPVISGVTCIVLPPPELASMHRNDRVVTLRDNNQLAIYAPGQEQPIAMTKALDDAARGLAWLSATGKPTTRPSGGPERAFVTWTGRDIAVVDADGGGFLWECPLGKVPGMEVVNTTAGEPESTDASADDNPDANGNRVIRGPGGRLIIRGQRGVVVRQAVMAQQLGVLNAVNGEPAQPPTAPPGDEQVWQVRPAGDRILVATSTGRLLCLGAADGKLLWQTRLTNHPIDRVLTNEDFTVLKITTEDNGVQLIVIDNYDGQIQSLKKFASDSTLMPINVALSDDGVLAWTLADRVQARDLYEPGDAVMDSTGGRTTNLDELANNPGGQPAPIYAAMALPDQLVFADGNILSVENGGHFLTVHPLVELQKTLLNKSTPAMPVPLQTESTDPNTVLRVSGPWVYCIGPKSLQAYNLKDGGAKAGDDHWYAWDGKMENPTTPNIRDAFVGKDVVALLDDPAGQRSPRNLPSPAFFLHLFSRRPVVNNPDQESGNYLYRERLGDDPDHAGILQVQPVEGGFCYLSGDHKLHMLRGARAD